MTQHLQPVANGRAPAASGLARPRGGDSLADVLERVLDKGVVIVGDVGVNVLDIELLTLKVRLLIASADTARSMGIDWWTSDPFLNGDARRAQDENRDLRARLAELERRLDGDAESDGGSDGEGSGRREPGATRRSGQEARHDH